MTRVGPGRCVLALVLALTSPGCSTSGPPQEDATTTPSRPLAAVLERHTPELMSIPGVVATAESRLDDGSPCILVLVVRLTPELREKLPRRLEGWPVRVEESGEIRALPDSGR
jgi:hypothetical protein